MHILSLTSVVLVGSIYFTLWCLIHLNARVQCCLYRPRFAGPSFYSCRKCATTACGVVMLQNSLWIGDSCLHFGVLANYVQEQARERQHQFFLVVQQLTKICLKFFVAKFHCSCLNFKMSCSDFFLKA